jgi:murein L,D-transpeptidase YcbB/YkuD
MMRLSAARGCVGAILMMLAAAPVRAEDAIETSHIYAHLAGESKGLIDGTRLDLPALWRFYGDRELSPAWLDGGTVSARAESLQAVLRAADSEGLNPQDYNLSAIQTRLASNTPAARAELDLLLTDALMNYARHVSSGRILPEKVNPQFAVPAKKPDVAAVASAALNSADIRAYLADLAPKHPEYAALRNALRTQRATPLKVKWPVIPDGPALRPGMSDPSVQQLRERLAATGELSGKAADANYYDHAVESAVRKFQARQGLDADGVVGATTRALLNVSPQDRLEQIVVNMERLRWLPAELGPKYVLVNVASFRLKAVENGDPVLDMPVVVGTTDRRTPVLSTVLTQVIFNPTWTVPPTIAKHDMLQKLRRDPYAFAAANIAIYDSWAADAYRIDPTRVNWNAVSEAAMLRFRIRQDAGSQNPLGRVKFLMPNKLDIYLHDTPQQSKFGRSVRTFSSGCIRVADPMALSDFLLRDLPSYSAERRNQLIDSGRTKAISVPRPVPVHVVYNTAWLNPQGSLVYGADIYGRDAELGRALGLDRQGQRVVAAN